jgi:hypothetical protein
MSGQINGQSKFSNFMIWNVLKNKNVYAHLFQYAFMISEFHDFKVL